VDNDFSLDVADIASTVQTHDVIAIGFVAVGQRLLLDFRATEIDGPLVRVVLPVKSVEERYRHLKQIRPRFGPPERIVAIHWPRFAGSLRTTKVWDEIMRRISESGHPEAVRKAEDALAELETLERKQQQNAITGEGFRTIWASSHQRR
jgi:hypothetical protein